MLLQLLYVVNPIKLVETEKIMFLIMDILLCTVFNIE